MSAEMSLSVSFESAVVLVAIGVDMNSCSLSILPVSRQSTFWTDRHFFEKTNISHGLMPNSSYFHLRALEG